MYLPECSSVELSVSAEGLVLEISRFGVHIEGCDISWSRGSFPRVSSDATLEARALDCNLRLFVTAHEIDHNVDTSTLRAERGTAIKDKTHSQQIKFTVRKMTIEPQKVELNRLLTTVRGSWLSLVYAGLLTAFKKHLRETIQDLVVQGLKELEGSVAEWISITILAILQAERDEGAASGEDDQS